MFGEEDFILWGVPQVLSEKKRRRPWSMRLVFLCFILWLASSAAFGSLVALLGMSNVAATVGNCGNDSPVISWWDPLTAR
ncbi:hypothetical protein BDZ45DRAFT_673014 [Acephala macrosclerotiorum]|nr:hypothetical protein BDZ45DRAFT_673014 [Acephala macrosclerotiorum]